MRFISCSGTPDKPIRSSKVNVDGSIDVVVTGQENLQAMIDSFADACDINNIIARFNNGDAEALSVHTPIYGDFTTAPKTYAEMLQKVIDGKDMFDHLDPAIKAKFNNDFNQFFKESGDDQFLEKLGYVPKTNDVVDKISDKVDNVVEKFEKEVITNES